MALVSSLNLMRIRQRVGYPCGMQAMQAVAVAPRYRAAASSGRGTVRYGHHTVNPTVEMEATRLWSDLRPKVSATNRDDLFVAVSHSYAAGRRKAVPAVPIDINDIDGFLSKLPEEDVARIRISTGPRRQALTAARKGELALARGLFKTALGMLHLEKMTREGRFVALNLIKPAESYIRYKQNDYRQAHALMEEALSCSNVLRDEFGYEDMDARRVHLASNLMRLESHSGEARTAARIGFQLLHYVEGDGESWPLTNLAAATNDVRIPAPLRTTAFNQAAWELALLFAHGGKATQAVALEEGDRAAAQRRTKRTHRIESLALWTRARRALAEADHTAFLAQASLFFPEGHATPMLWLALAADICRVCDEAGGGRARSLRMTITDHLSTQKKFQQLMSIRG